MTPTMATSDFDEDDYKSDECDENLSTELFYDAFFNEHSISMSCESFVNANRCSEPAPDTDTAGVNLSEVALNSGEAKFTAELASFLSRIDPNGPAAICPTVVAEVTTLKATTSSRQDAETEGLAAKLEPSATKKEKLLGSKRKQISKRKEPAAVEQKIPDDSEDSDDINANIRKKRKKVEMSRVSSTERTRKRRSADLVKKKEPKSIKTVAKCQEDADLTLNDSISLATLLPELSSDDEISLSEAEGIELNVVSFARGIPDQVTLSSDLSPAEHKRLWHVDADDKYRHLRRHRYHSVKDCRNCRATGHLSHECPEPERIVCYLCGETTHFAVRCPNRICSTCKDEGHSSYRCFRMQRLLDIRCNICGIFGHTKETCPDNWRRYHCTIVEGPPTVPERKESLSHGRKFCSWCGLQGHLAFECRRATNTGIASRAVHSYREPSLQHGEANCKKRLAKKLKREKADAKRQQRKKAQQGRDFVLGTDFIPLPGSSKKKSQKAIATNEKLQLSSQFRAKSKRTERSTKFAERNELRNEFGTSRRKRKREDAADDESVNPNDDTSRNRRKERRKLKRMQLRNEREKHKNKTLKQKRMI